MTYKTNKIKIAVCSALMCILLFACLLIHMNGLESIAQRLEDIVPEKSGDMDTMLWLIQHIFYALPVSLCIILQAIACKIRRADAYTSHREKFFESLITTAFTFLVILPACIAFTGVLNEGGKATYESMVWFVWQIIPLSAVLFYQKLRMDELCDKNEDEKK